MRATNAKGGFKALVLSTVTFTRTTAAVATTGFCTALILAGSNVTKTRVARTRQQMPARTILCLLKSIMRSASKGLRTERSIR
jgi:hypothetical protein